MFTASLVGKTELIQRLAAMTPNVLRALKQAVTSETIKLQAHVIRDKLQGQVLNNRSGDLARSIQQDVTSTDLSVFGRVFSSGDVKYAHIHEYGGTIHIPEIVPDKAKALAFTIGGKQVFAMRTKAHDVHMPERSFLRSALADNAVEITLALKRAAIEGLQRVAA